MIVRSLIGTGANVPSVRLRTVVIAMNATAPRTVDQTGIAPQTVQPIEAETATNEVEIVRPMTVIAQRIAIGAGIAMSADRVIAKLSMV